MNEAELLLKSILAQFLRPTSAEPAGYRVFTTRYDLVVDAETLDREYTSLGIGARSAIDEAWSAFTETLAAWKIRLAALALASAERVGRETTQEARHDMIVSLLVDLSGSMKGEKILLAAAAVDAAQDYLGGLGIRSEVLGFTTRTWRGGRCRRDWYLTGSRPNPGRLNELLHIVFKSADDIRRSTEGWSLRQMFRPGILKENIDGEAIEWAVGRLRAAAADRRILLVMSDGAPVDDATLIANGTTYLRDHLISVIAATTAAGDVELAALGIGHDVDRYYERSAAAKTPAEIGERLFELLERLLIDPSPSPAPATA